MAPRTSADDRHDGALLRARALSVPTRAAIVELLREADGPMTAHELAERLGVHHTAVRQHATVLAEAGLITGEPLPPIGRGRPRTGFRATSVPDPYRHLASMLAEAVRDGVTARTVGRRHGGVVTRPGGDSLEILRAEAERLGFRPQVRELRNGSTELVLGSCPFADLAVEDPHTVCSLHRGMAEGVAERNSGIEVRGLHVADPHRGGCRIVLRRV